MLRIHDRSSSIHVYSSESLLPLPMTRPSLGPGTAHTQTRPRHGQLFTATRGTVPAFRSRMHKAIFILASAFALVGAPTARAQDGQVPAPQAEQPSPDARPKAIEYSDA